MSEVVAHLKNLRVGPRKVRLLADLIRGRSLHDALSQLDAQTKHAARDLQKLLLSAAANATHNFKLSKDDLMVKTITVSESMTIKRSTPRAFGRATPIRKRGSHVTVRLASTAPVITAAPTTEAKPASKPKAKRATSKAKTA